MKISSQFICNFIRYFNHAFHHYICIDLVIISLHFTIHFYFIIISHTHSMFTVYFLFVTIIGHNLPELLFCNIME